MVKGMEVGRAYGFFQCSASKEEIDAALPQIREAVGTASDLELTLIKGPENLKDDGQIVDFAQQARMAGMNYVLQATHPHGTNRQAADEVAPILNQAYQSHLYGAGESFKGEIIYESGGEYIFRG